MTCFSFDVSEEEAKKKFGSDTLLQFHTYRKDNHSIRYVRLDHSTRKPTPTILFVHGSPGGWGDYMDYLKEERLQLRAQMISIDRPGYGGSGRGRVERSIERQAELLASALEQNRKDGPVLLVGHSLGGAIVIRMAMDYPDFVQGIVIVAGSVSPALEERRWYNAVGSWAIVRWLLPTDFRTSNEEILPLQAELEKMTSLWKKIQVPVTVIHGKKDALVATENADFLRQMLAHTSLRVIQPENYGHFILWKNTSLIVNEMIQLLDSL